MDPEPRVIRQEIDETRQSLTEKLETLENQVMGTVQQARDTVQDTIDTVKSTVTDTVDSVKRTFDIEYQVSQRPFVCSGLSFAAGFMAGALIKGAGQHRSFSNGTHASHLGQEPTQFSRDNEFGSYNGQMPESAARFSSVAEPKSKNLFSDELTRVKGLALGTLMGLVRDYAKQSLPQSLAPHIDEVIDSATAKLGGQPLGSVISRQSS
ncbi:MAG TPA: hypothetical protein VGZ25_06480 [Gemmataceae bacterium]|jgi:ElaB/YqjD/DUF883 family membrane-anchored ribosome-binding protein|nr:hypothetical protein [Gemmataceae bacterium]